MESSNQCTLEQPTQESSWTLSQWINNVSQILRRWVWLSCCLRNQRKLKKGNNGAHLPTKSLILIASVSTGNRWLIHTSISIVGMATSFSFGSLIRGQLLGSLIGPRCFLWAVTSWYARSIYAPHRSSTARTSEGFSERSFTIRSLAAFTLS